VIILPETSLEQAVRTADRLREKIAAEAGASVPESYGVRVTVSAGVACFPENGTNREDLFSLMDSYLYKAKSMGKNIVCHAAQES
jgi:diguanylate cyclase (GGDEF)-like protein